jgi:hypothetical protein
MSHHHWHGGPVEWYEQSAMGDLLGEDFDLVQKDNLYRCFDKLLAHKTELFSFLQQRWDTLFDPTDREPVLVTPQFPTHLGRTGRLARNLQQLYLGTIAEGKPEFD